MKPMTDVDKHRRPGKDEAKKSLYLPTGKEQETCAQNAREHESSARAKAWRDSNLRPPT